MVLGVRLLQHSTVEPTYKLLLLSILVAQYKLDSFIEIFDTQEDHTEERECM